MSDLAVAALRPCISLRQDLFELTAEGLAFNCVPIPHDMIPFLKDHPDWYEVVDELNIQLDAARSRATEMEDQLIKIAK